MTLSIICGTIRNHLKKAGTDTQMQFYKDVARPTLLYGSETWVTTKRDMTCLEAARDALSKKCQRVHKTRQSKKRRHKKRTRGLWNKRCERDPNTNKTGSTILKEWTTPDFRNTPSTTNLEEEEIVDATGNDGNASMPEQVKRPNPRRKMMMMMMH